MDVCVLNLDVYPLLIMLPSMTLRFLLIVLSFTSPVTAQTIFKKVGDTVILDPGQAFVSPTGVTWKHQADIAMEWFGEDVTCFRGFKGRCNLDKTNGNFIIKNLMLEDTGSYTPEINDKVLPQKELRVLKPVPKPTVTTQCNNDETHCRLTCEANITAEFEPVSYEWKSGNKTLHNKELIVTRDNEETSFICRLKNDVSESSVEVSNPISRDNTGAIAAAVVVPLLILIAAGIVFFLCKKGVFNRFFNTQQEEEQGRKDADIESQSLIKTTDVPPTLLINPGQNSTDQRTENQDQPDLPKSDVDQKSSSEPTDVKQEDGTTSANSNTKTTKRSDLSGPTGNEVTRESQAADDQQTPGRPDPGQNSTDQRTENQDQPGTAESDLNGQTGNEVTRESQTADDQQTPGRPDPGQN